MRPNTKILFYISKLFYPKYNPFWFVFYMYWSYFRIMKRKFTYNLKSKPGDYILEFLTTQPQYFDDVNSTVVVHAANLYKTDRILKLFCPKKKKYRTVHVFPSQLCPEDALYCSETLFHNLKLDGFEAPLRLLSVSDSLIRFADEIDVSLINCPYDISNGVIDALLGSYFSTPKLINAGDIFEINIRYFAAELFYVNNKINHVDCVYFKCNKLSFDNVQDGGSYFSVIGETAIKQSANVQSFMPEKSTKIKKSSGPEELPLCPYGLQVYLDGLERAVHPFIKKRNIGLNPVFLLQGERGCGKEILVTSLARRLGMHFCKINNADLTANIYAQNETRIRNVLFNAKMAAPCIISIHNFENFGKNNEGEHDERIMGYFADELANLFENNPYPVLLFCCSNSKTIPTDLKKLFLETFDVDAPDAMQRKENLRWIIQDRDTNTDANLDEVADKTHGFFFEDLKALVYFAERDSDGAVVCREGFSSAIDYMQANYNESIGAPKVPKVEWADVGGLGDVKEEIIKTINLPLRHPELLETSGLKRSGILLFGPPGTGKTLIAKAVATECSLCFLSVKGPELLNMYVGQSEQNVREVFERARQASPCVVFFDELDSLAPNRGASGDSGGVMDRVVSQLLAEMDGLNDSATVFVIGATNRPDLIDPALLRPGRFDKLLYVGPCTDEASKISVLKALTRRFKIEENVRMVEVVRLCPPNVTGADFYGICATAWTSAARRVIERVENGEVEAENLTKDYVVVSFQDFKTAVADVKPTVSKADLDYFEQLKREMGSNR
ncbi:hypothetical protein NQ315_006239 [Exocentrus adspersus]|uniref:Peroxisomal ATPase PEX6 n=1 Tax=Exocentrus adspersus TaxID=1586481 RepID=A0AAV8VZF5_9CUCU|nr:hypothetical protein NQ315_006239 [Exocentrus adspersus]